jgi:hypothetical protein
MSQAVGRRGRLSKPVLFQALWARMAAHIKELSMEHEVRRLVGLESRVAWMRPITLAGSVICSFWLIYRVYEANGVALAIGAFVALSLIYKFGASPMFAVATSFLCFKYRAIGIWLPVLSYVLGSVLLYVDAKVDKLAREAGA